MDLESVVVDTEVAATATVPLSSLRRVFKIGDHIRVCHGRDKGRRGTVVDVDGPLITFLDLDARVSTDAAKAMTPANPAQVCGPSMREECVS